MNYEVSFVAGALWLAAIVGGSLGLCWLVVKGINAYQHWSDMRFYERWSRDRRRRGK